VLRAFKTACMHIEPRPTGPLEQTGGRISCYPRLVLSAALKGGVAAERNPGESAVTLALHFPSHQDFHSGTV
jgi:hypothetical protein